MGSNALENGAPVKLCMQIEPIFWKERLDDLKPVVFDLVSSRWGAHGYERIMKRM